MNAIVDEDLFVAVLEDEYCDQDDGFNWIAEIDPSDSGDETFIPDASESGMESPPITEDDRRVEPALQDHHTQGGSTKSKLPEELSACNARPRMPTVPDEPHGAADMEEEKYLPCVVMCACMNFEYLYGLDPGTVTSKMIEGGAHHRGLGRSPPDRRWPDRQRARTSRWRWTCGRHDIWLLGIRREHRPWRAQRCCLTGRQRSQ